MKRPVFTKREAVQEGLALPAVLNHSFVGGPVEIFEQRTQEMIAALIEPERLRAQTFKRRGAWVACKYRIHHERLEQVEALYEAAGALEGLKFLI